jgi:hypothetical protein
MSHNPETFIRDILVRNHVSPYGNQLQKPTAVGRFGKTGLAKEDV